MADPFTRPETFAAGAEIVASQHNDNWDAIEDYLDARLGAATQAQIWVANSSGQAVPRTITGDATISDAGVVTVSGSKGGTRGKSIIATEEARTNTAYGLMTTPDQVASVVLPTDGLLRITYQAMWKETIGQAARAAIFIGATQVKVARSGQAAPVVQEAGDGPTMGDANTYHPLGTGAGGLVSGDGVSAYTGDVTTGQIVGVDRGYEAGEVDPEPQANGSVEVFAAAGTYSIGVLFKASSGSVTAKNRKLWVEAIGF